MLERLSWTRLVLELMLCCLLALILGSLLGSLSWWLLVSVIGLLAWHFHNLLRLSRWLWVDRSMTPPPGRGSWEPLFHGLHLMQMRNKKRRRELGRLIKRFRSGAESLPDAVILTTRDGTLLWCNGLAQRLFNLRWPEDHGQNILNLLRYPSFTRYLQSREFSQPLALELTNGNSLECRIMSYSDEQWLIVARDVTQMRQLEGMRRHFFANVSHELRTPLTVLHGYLEMLREQDLAPGLRDKALHTMAEQTSRMEGLVKQLLTLSRIEAAPPVSLTERVDMPSILKMVEQETATLSLNHTVNFNVDAGLQVLGNEDQLRSAVSNLVYNAINHTPPGSMITVGWQRSAAGARFSVVDNGPGIAPEHIPRLTERFYRVDKARSRQTGGSGLGLAIVKHALAHHDSHLEITSRAHEGTVFTFLLGPRFVVPAAMYLPPAHPL